ncbi:VCBS repeat-containing protein [Alteromonas pelagimontana]|uniref:VCBS repeat-containing protein n=1 Tax=Alteromonas pelagimontana TaxID=1858656 RepID=A0A6M4MCJ4_9ALTE|nr:VCBS repeat-containing protein [Alteromonas pelagimontana]QJR80767.1 VCBS repeat-containing protein [Alteromonas pelagimontana]
MYVFSAVDKSQLSSLPVSDTCDTRAFNLYNDSTVEVLVSDCQWGNVTAYTLNASNQLEAIWQVDLQDHGSTSLAVGDIDNDGANEVLWGSGVSSSGADVLVTADFTADSATLKASTTGAQLDSFSASGWSEIAPGDERGVFLVPSTESGYSGMAVATLTQEGQLTTSNELSSGWRYSNYSATTDFNNDGAGDIFLPAADSNTEGFGVFQLSDMSVHWAMASNGSSDVGQIKAMDVNGDGYDDAIVADGKTLKVFDIQNQLQLASYSFASTISGFDAVIIDGTLNVVVTQYELLQLLKMGASSFSAHGFVEDLYCNNVRFFGKDEDKSLVCWGADSYFQTLSLVDNEFGAIKHIATDFRVNDIEVDPTDPNRFLIASHASDGWGTAFSNIHSVTSDGYVIWSSPSLIGSANDASLRVREQADGKLEILFGSGYGMYWIH